MFKRKKDNSDDEETVIRSSGDDSAPVDDPELAELVALEAEENADGG